MKRKSNGFSEAQTSMKRFSNFVMTTNFEMNEKIEMFEHRSRQINRY